MKRLLSIINLLTWCLALCAIPTNDGEAAEAVLARIDNQIEEMRLNGDVENEAKVRWQKIVTLKNYAMTKQQAEEAGIQMEWFRRHNQWDYYYRAWQLKANAMSALGKLQLALQETQRMLNDAQERNNKLGRAMAYKQIGVIYLNMKQTEPAIEALQHYYELMKDDESDFNSISNIYYRMAKAYDYDKAYDKELEVTGRWKQFLVGKVGKIKRPDVRECYNECYLARAASFIGLKRFDDAYWALDTAGHHAHLTNTNLSLHHYYKMQARYQMARGDAAKTLVFTDSVRMVTKERDDHTDELRAQALMALGRGVEAASIYQRLYLEKDSVFGREARQHLDELNTLFQVDEIKTEQQRTKLRYMRISAISIILTLLLLLFYGWRSAIRQKRANELLRIANERAKVSSKMKSEFIRNITHEIRTPLNIVSGFTQILTGQDSSELSPDAIADIKERMSENADRITKIVDRMLELSEASTETVIERNDKVTARELVTEAIEHSRIDLHTRPDNAESAVTFRFPEEKAASAFTLLTHKRYAIRTLAQLLENAVKFTHEGSITLRMETTDDSLRFIVEDTGIGIPAAETEHVFEEFVQLDEFADGTGIGLTVARSLARRMEGDLWLDATYSQGACFVLELKRN